MTHYVCRECGYTMKTRGVCENENCHYQGAKLHVCNCTDNHHHGILNHPHDHSNDTHEQEGEESVGRGGMIDLDSEETL